MSAGFGTKTDNGHNQTFLYDRFGADERDATMLKAYDRVKVAAIRNDRFSALPIHYKRHPEVGDVAVIVRYAPSGMRLRS